MKIQTKREYLIERYLIIATLIMVQLTCLFYGLAYPQIIFHRISKEIFFSITILQFVGFIFCYFRNSINCMRVICVYPSIVLMILIVFTFGGIKSPGVLWITGTPIFFGVFYKRSGMIMGSGVMIATFTIFFALDKKISSLSYPLSLLEYDILLKSNIVQFSILTTVYFSFYVWLESNARRRMGLINKKIDTLLHVVLHDLSNPITVLKLKMSKLAREYSINEKSLALIDKSFNKVEEIITDVRSFQLDAESNIGPKSKIDSSKIKEFCREFFHQHNNKNLKFNIIDETQRGFYCEERVMYDHILSNIMSNAIKFSHEGHEITLKLFNDSNRFYIDISDQGIGMSQELIDQVFQFEKKTSRLGTKGEVGTGYGLPIVKYFTDFSDGSIQINSTINQGTNVSLAFNLARN